MKIIMLAALLIFPTIVIAADSAQSTVSVSRNCLRYGDHNKMMEWGFLLDDPNSWSPAYVLYGKNKNPISIFFKSSTNIDEVEGRPIWFSNKFSEIIDGKVTGEYVFQTQGALFIEGKYINYATNKITEITTQSAEFGEACNWK